MLRYKVFINHEIFISGLRMGVERQLIMNFISSLADNPNCVGDFPEKDHAGRMVQIKIVGRFAVTFWADHAVSEVKVTHIKPADR